MSNSYEWVYARTHDGYRANINTYVSFLNSNNKVILSDSVKDFTANFGGKNISDVTNSSFIKEGHILVTCNKLTQVSTSTSREYIVDTYVNYGFGY